MYVGLRLVTVGRPKFWQRDDDNDDDDDEARRRHHVPASVPRKVWLLGPWGRGNLSKQADGLQAEAFRTVAPASLDTTTTLQENQSTYCLR